MNDLEFARRIIVRRAIDVLNDCLRTDPDAINALMQYEVPVNDALAGHPTVQVGMNLDSRVVLRPLGLINGLFGIREDGYGHIVALVDKDGKFIRFCTSEEIRG